MPLNPGDTVLIESARLVFRNFAGKEGPMNAAGDRNFCVLLDDQIATNLERDGWNVKYLAAREEGEANQPYIQISIGRKGRPAKVVMITSRGRTDLSDDEIELLDWADYENVDLIFHPYNWEVGGKTGVKAYLKSIFVTVREDELDLKYGGIPDAQARAGAVDEG
jgi:hypothetical protein